MNLFVSLQLDKGSSLPLYHQLYQQLKTLITSKTLKENEKLPAVRKLARELGVNNITVINAYRMLEKEGLIYSKTGSGTYVLPHQTIISSENITLQPSRGIPELDIMDHGQVKITADTINFASAIPTPELFPVEDFKKILNEVLDRDRGNAFGYHESQGFFPLRESICGYLEKNGIKADINNIQIISGAQQGIDIVAKSLLNYGDYVITENPTYTGAIAAFKSRGVNIIPVDIEPDGISISGLEKAINDYKPKLIYVMPSFQNPTGYCYSIEKQKSLLELCSQENVFVVEDDSFTELYYDGKARCPLKTLDDKDNVVYIKSFSKIFMPGLRVAFLLSPQSAISRLIAAKHTSDITTSGLMQRAFDLYLRNNLWQKHIQFMKDIYQQRYNLMLSSFNKHLPEEITYFPPGGGLTIWLSLSADCSPDIFYQQCLKEQVIVTPGNLFYPDNLAVNRFRISFAAVYPEFIEKGIIKLGQCYRQSGNLSTKRTEYSPLL